MTVSWAQFENLRSIFLSKEAPYKGVIVDIVEYPQDTYALRMYNDNIESYSDPQKLSIFEWIKERLETIEALLPHVTIGLQVEQEVPNYHGK